MSFESTLKSHLGASTPLAALVGNRITPLIRVEAESVPAVTYQVVTKDRLNNLDGADTGLANVRVQLDSWARTFSDVIAVADAVRLRMAVSSTSLVSVTLETFADDYEPDTRLYRRLQEFSCWYKF